jgi:hypothetical protein
MKRSSKTAGHHAKHIISMRLHVYQWHSLPFRLSLTLAACSAAAAATVTVTRHVTFDHQFDYGHMDFTFSAKEELGYYVSSLLMRT